MSDEYPEGLQRHVYVNLHKLCNKKNKNKNADHCRKVYMNKAPAHTREEECGYEHILSKDELSDCLY